MLDLRRALQRQRLREPAAPVDLPCLPEGLVWTVLEFVGLQDLAHCGAASRSWRRAAEHRFAALLRAQERTVKTRWATTGRALLAGAAQEHARANVLLGFDWKRGVGPVVRAQVDLATAVFAPNRCDGFGCSPLDERNVLPMTGHRVGRRRWPAGSRGAASAVDREAPWADDAAIDEAADEDLPGGDAQVVRRLASKGRFVAAEQPICGGDAGTESACVRRTFDGALCVRLLCEGQMRMRNKKGRLSCLLEVLPTHLRVTVNGVCLDAFYGDGEESWAPLRNTLEALAAPIERRAHVGLQGPWEWQTDVAPSTRHTPLQLQDMRFELLRQRQNDMELALERAGCRFSSVAQLRALDFWCKESLRCHVHPLPGGPDFAADQLGFTAHRHRRALDTARLVAVVQRAERRLDEARRLGGADADPALATDAATQELLLSWAWAARCGFAEQPWLAPPRPAHSGVDDPAPHAQLFTNKELEGYSARVTGHKPRAIVLCRALKQPPAY